jgi:hypothetical protein
MLDLFLCTQLRFVFRLHFPVVSDDLRNGFKQTITAVFQSLIRSPFMVIACLFRRSALETVWLNIPKAARLGRYISSHSRVQLSYVFLNKIMWLLSRLF